MAIPRLNRNAGLVVLGIWLILHGLISFIPLTLPPVLMSALALIAGVLLLLGM